VAALATFISIISEGPGDDFAEGSHQISNLQGCLVKPGDDVALVGLGGIPWESHGNPMGIHGLEISDHGCHLFYPLVMADIAIENGHRNSGFSHEKW